jgi:hypothetical protein
MVFTHYSKVAKHREIIGGESSEITGVMVIGI